MSLIRIDTVSALVLLTARAALVAQLIPVGPEFRVNEAEARSWVGPALALDASGTLLAAWSGPGLISNDVLVRTFERSGQPRGPETSVSTPGLLHMAPAAATVGADRFVAAWQNSENPLSSRTFAASAGAGQSGTVSARLIGADGAPLGPELRLDSKDRAFYEAVDVRVAARPSGGFLATWMEIAFAGGFRIVGRSFGADGAPEGAELTVAQDVWSNHSVSVLADGGFLAFWLPPPAPIPLPPLRQMTLWGRRTDPAGQPASPVLQIPDGQVAAAPDGRFAVAWTSRPLGQAGPNDLEAYVRLYGPGGGPLTLETLVAGGPGNQVVEAVAMDEAGRLLVVWSNDYFEDDTSVDADLFARLFSAAGQPLGPSFTVASGPGDQFGATAAEEDGEWVIAWVSEPPGSGGGNLFARRFAACANDGSSLCLGGRFRAEVTWKTPFAGQPAAQTGPGVAVPLTGDTGAFWFFSRENLELVVKALDGRAVNGRFWIFYGALSDVEYDLTVTDTHTGEAKTYHNPAGTMASRADTRAFAGEGPFGALVPVTPIPWGGGAPILPWPCPDGQLCLDAFNFFAVEVTWRIPATGETGRGTPVRVTDDTGYFWFFDERNVELMIKMVDGHAVNGKRWIFYGALSDVEYMIKVTDRRNGKSKTYHNPAGTMASRADTMAF